jgi:eukaryotic-like serine/threonine-protein kinase
MNVLHQLDDVLIDRYQILSFLGQGGMGTTFVAQDLQTDQKVAIKAIALRGIDDFKMLELFDREAGILDQLKHPNIPRYLDHFQIDQRRDRRFYLVQQLAEGEALAELVEQGWRPQEAEVRAIAEQILKILIYLQQLTPPVIHRDIKPQNLIRNAAGQIFLVDFGAVQASYHNTMTAASTVVGTYGYMAPEQFRGQAVLATDLYGLGTTLITLLSGKVPADLPQRQLKLQFQNHIQVSKPFQRWLERVLEPIPEDRFPSATAALAVLQGRPETEGAGSDFRYGRPRHNLTRLDVGPQHLIVEMPAVKLSTAHSRLLLLMPVAWELITLTASQILFNSLGLNLLSLLRIFNCSSGGMAGNLSPQQCLQQALSSTEVNACILFFVLTQLFGLVLMGYYGLSAWTRIRFTIDDQALRFTRKLGPWQLTQSRVGRSHQLKCSLRPLGLTHAHRPMTCIQVQSNLRYQFGTCLTEAEKAWLLSEIQHFLTAPPNS